VQLSERNAEAEKALYKVSELSAKVEEQKELIARLEEDIQKVSFLMYLPVLTIPSTWLSLWALKDLSCISNIPTTSMSSMYAGCDAPLQTSVLYLCTFGRRLELSSPVVLIYQ
jgi:hypothetical protein